MRVIHRAGRRRRAAVGFAAIGVAGALFLGGRLGVYGLAWGVVIGSLLHLLVQVPVVVLQGLVGRAQGPEDQAQICAARDAGVQAIQHNVVTVLLGIIEPPARLQVVAGGHAFPLPPQR